MWRIGDDTQQAAFLAALAASHGYSARVECWYAGELLGEVEFESGTVQVSSGQRERRSVEDLTVAEELWPVEVGDLLSPYGVWIRILVTITAGATTYPAIPVFAGKVLDVKRQRWSGKLSIKAADPFWQVNRESFETPRPAPRRTLVVDVVRQLLLEVFPAGSLTDLTGSTAYTPAAGLMWDAAAGSRGDAIDALAAGIGAEVYAAPDQVWPFCHFVIRPVPTLGDDVAWTPPDGQHSVVEADQLSQSGEGIVNRWIVLVERSDGSKPLYVTATDDDPFSPTRYGGPMGKLVDFYSNSSVTSVAAGQAAANALLSRSLGLARQRSVTLVANPALEAGDVLGIGVDGESVETHIADEFDVPLTQDPPSMSIATRSTTST